MFLLDFLSSNKLPALSKKRAATIFKAWLINAGISINIFVDYRKKFLEIFLRRVAATTVATILILMRKNFKFGERVFLDWC